MHAAVLMHQQHTQPLQLSNHTTPAHQSLPQTECTAARSPKNSTGMLLDTCGRSKGAKCNPTHPPTNQPSNQPTMQLVPQLGHSTPSVSKVKGLGHPLQHKGQVATAAAQATIHGSSRTASPCCWSMTPVMHTAAALEAHTATRCRVLQWAACPHT
jgi:hypothetical protein